MPDIPVAILKKNLREKLLKQRRSLSDEMALADSQKCIAYLTTHPLYKSAKNILVYVALADEVSTHQLFQKSIHKKELFVPAILGDEMTAARFESLEKMKPGRYGILEPQGLDSGLLPASFDLIVLPGVAFDLAGNRLGMGKGYFDRFLKKYPTTPRVALAFDFQVVDKVPTGDYDVPVSHIFTEKRVITCE